MIAPERLEQIKKTLIGVAILSAVFLALIVGAWNSVFHYVGPNEMLVVISKSGDDLAEGQLLAQPGQKGPLELVLGEGRHFITPILYEVERRRTIVIPPLKVGVRISLTGTPLPPGRILAGEGERGTRRNLLPPGRHRLNPYAFTVEIRDATVVPPGYVGFVTNLVGTDPGADAKRGKGGIRFVKEGEKGILENVLQPGIYYLNPYAKNVRIVEVGLNQVSFLGRDQIRFPSKDAFDIRLDSTVEWELEPSHVARVLNEFGSTKEIEEKVLIAQSRSIGRLEGSRYGAKEFLLGSGREEIQRNFTEKLVTICKGKGISVHSAYIRAIRIPEKLLVPIREAFVAVEKERTAKVQQETLKSAAILEREQRTIEQARQEVRFQTEALVLEIAAGASKEVGQIEAETRRLEAEQQREIARLDAQTTELLGRANADVVGWIGDARAGLFKLKVDAFKGDSAAFARYAFAEALPKDLQIRLVQTGEGTFWTDLNTAGGGGLLKLWAKQQHDRQQTRKRK
ncbi:MAG: hypothetical protein JKY65_16415 [Planctomycetes bacterium]|nr:hypothetical protein [Planctomycetota bacterium]